MDNQEWQRRYFLNRYHQRKAWAFDFLGGCCAECGSKERLEIDHIDPSTKAIELSVAWGVGAERFVAELLKCQVLCYDCHKKKTATEQRRDVHGTWGMVRNRKCKCDVCREFVNAYNREWKRKEGRASKTESIKARWWNWKHTWLSTRRIGDRSPYGSPCGGNSIW